MPDARESLDEGVRYLKLGMLDRALAEFHSVAEHAEDPTVFAEALCREAHTHRAACRWYDAIATARRCVAVARNAKLSSLEAEGLNAEAIVHQELGQFESAIALLEEALALDPAERIAGLIHQNLGSIAAQRADLATAEHHFERSHHYFTAAGYEWGQAFALNNRAAAALDAGRLREAEVLSGQALIAASKVGDLELSGIASLNNSEALAAQGRLEEAERRALEALGYFGREENALRTSQCLRVLGDVMVLRDERDGASQLYRTALHLAQGVGIDREVTRIEDCMELLQPVA